MIKRCFDECLLSKVEACESHLSGETVLPTVQRKNVLKAMRNFHPNII
jgi:hypothetical protein